MIFRKLLFCALAVSILVQLSAAQEWATIANPSTRCGARMIYDAENKRMVMFGGEDSRLPWGDHYNDVWVLHGELSDNKWQLLSPEGTPPSPRARFCAIYDSSAQRMILFGGHRDFTNFFDDVWALTLESGSECWEEIDITGISPSPRAHASAVYDDTRQRMIVFGGNSHGQLLNDAWAFDLVSLEWSSLTPSGAPPLPRQGSAAIYDRSESRMIVFGGLGSGLEGAGPDTLPSVSTPSQITRANAGFFNDVWSLDLDPGSESWTELSVSGDVPGRVQALLAVCDQSAGRMYIFGGESELGYPEDVFYLELASLEWTKIVVSPKPPGRRGLCGAFDYHDERVVVFGGNRFPGYYFGDTHAFTVPDHVEKTFTDVTAISGISVSMNFVGLAWGDFNNDGYQDLYSAYCLDEPNILYQNNGDGTFSDVTATAGVGGGSVSANAAAWADYDSDGDLDLYVSNTGPNFLYRNNGGGTFTDVTSTAGVGNSGNGRNPAWADYDADGDLDLFVPNREQPDVLYRNNGDGTFTDVAFLVGMADTAGHGASWCDYDDDGDMDLYVCRYYRVNSLYGNNGDGTFTDVAEEAGVAHHGQSGVAWADYDNDGDFDLYICHNTEPNVLYQNNGDGTFTDVTETAGVGNLGSSRSGVWGDYDADGDLDLYVGNHFGGTSALYRNNGDGTFTEVMIETGIADISGGQNAAWCDYDNDGNLDICFTHRATGVLYRNNGNPNNWLEINLIGSDCNTSAIGTRVVVVTGDLRQVREVCGASGFNSQESLTLEYGLGEYQTVDTIKIRWPCGRITSLTDLPANQIMTITEDPLYACGDCNGDGSVSVADAMYLVNFIYRNGPMPLGQEDVNMDGRCSIADLAYITGYIYRGGPTPCEPPTEYTPSSDEQAEVAFRVPFVEEGIVEVSLVAEFEVPVAGVHLEVRYDPDALEPLTPERTTRTDNLDLFCEPLLEKGKLTLGMLSLDGHLVEPGSGSIVTLRFKKLSEDGEPSSLRIENVVLVDEQSRELTTALDRLPPTILPKAFSLNQNCPNPFWDETLISYALPSNGSNEQVHVLLKVYDSAGRLVRTLVNQENQAGYHTTKWNCRDNSGERVGAGVYFCTIETREFIATKKMTLLR